MAKLTAAEQAAATALLRSVAAGEVWHYFDRDGQSADIDHVRHRLVTTPVRRLQRDGLVSLNRHEPNTAKRKLWVLTDRGRAAIGGQ